MVLYGIKTALDGVVVKNKTILEPIYWLIIGGGDRRRHEKESHPVVVIAYSLYIETPNQRFRPAFLGR